MDTSSTGTSRRELFSLIGKTAGAAAMWWWQRPSPLHHAAIENGVLIAYDFRGHVSWTFASGGFERAPSYGSLSAFVQSDIDGDGSPEILVSRESAKENHDVVCLNASGTVRWTRPLGRPVRTAETVFDPPFRFRGLELLRGFPDGVPRILVAAHHHMWHPAQTLLLDIHGNIISEYWHSGHLTTFALFDCNRDGHPELLAAGINQARKVAELVVLDPFHMTGVSGEDNPGYQLLDMPRNVERARVLFSRTELGHLTAAYSVPVSIIPKRDSILLDVSESLGNGQPANSIAFELDRNLVLREVAPSDYFNLTQTLLVREGKLKSISTPSQLRQQLKQTFLVTPKW